MKFQTLESMRGVAAILVVVFHLPFVMAAQSPLVANSTMFVDFFFVLSGFVICFAYAERIQTGLSLREYLILRVGRLFPLHVALMLIWGAYFLVTLDWSGGSPTTDTLNSFLVNLFLLNSYGIEDSLGWNYPSWSISAELFAYLMFFFAVALLRHRLTAPVALAISVAAYALLATAPGETIVRTYDLGFLRCIGGFFLGVAMFKYHARRPKKARAFGSTAEFALLFGMLAVLMVPPGHLIAELALVVIFAGTVFVFAHSGGAISTVLQHPLPVHLGRISYSIYMVHGLIIILMADILVPALGLVEHTMLSVRDPERVFFVTPFAPALNLAILLATIAISAPAYRLIEQPFRDLSKKLSKRRSPRARASGALQTTGPGA